MADNHVLVITAIHHVIIVQESNNFDILQGAYTLLVCLW